MPVIHIYVPPTFLKRHYGICFHHPLQAYTTPCKKPVLHISCKRFPSNFKAVVVWTKRRQKGLAWKDNLAKWSCFLAVLCTLVFDNSTQRKNILLGLPSGSIWAGNMDNHNLNGHAHSHFTAWKTVKHHCFSSVHWWPLVNRKAMWHKQVCWHSMIHCTEYYLFTRLRV